MIKSLRLLFLTLACLWGSSVMAQQLVRGVVKDTNDEPIIGVNVVEQGSTNGTITGVDGSFTITVSGTTSVLNFSFIGYKSVAQTVGSNTSFNIVLEEDISQLGEVVVTALGFEEKKDNLGYASSSVQGGSLTKSGESTLINGLAGKVSGLRVSRPSGDPGAGSFIQIRGLSSITRNSQPLIVVDGIPISNDTRGDGGSTGVAQESRLNDLNPNDIESMSVLKGASAAALWGTKALGGVIFITTKKGDYNNKLKATFRTSYSIDKINRKYPIQTKFGQGDNGIFDQRARDSWGDKISERSGAPDEYDTSGEFFIDQNGTTYYPIVNKNSQALFNDSNFDQIFQDGHYTENSLSLSSGNKDSRIFLSLSDMNQEGIIRNNSAYRRSTVRINADQQLNSKLSISATANYSKTGSNKIQKGATSSGLYLGLLRTPPDFDQSGYRGDYYASSTASPATDRHRSYREPLGADGTPTYNNPLWTINEQDNTASVDRFITSLKLSADPTPWLNLIARFGLDQYSEKKIQFYTPGSASGEYNLGQFDSNLASNSIFNMDYIAKGIKRFNENFNGSLLVGFNYNQNRLSVNGIEISNFIQFTDVANGVRDIDNALPENRNVSSTFGRERTAGVYTTATLDAFDMLFISGSLRAESASTFGDESDNTFLFPSVSAAWQFSKIGNLQSEILSFGKLRASYGEVGVQPVRYNTSNVFVSPTYSDEYGGGLSLGLYGNGGFVPSTNRGNSSLKPERKKEIEFGTDLRFLNNKLSLSATYYSNRTEDVLLNFPIANSRGYDEIYSNAAIIENKGVEIDLGYHILETGNFSWSVNAQYSQVRNKVVDMVGVQSINLGGLAAVSSRAVEGQPMGVLWGSRTLRDDAGNIVFDSNGFPEQDELEGVIGDPNPDYQGGLSSNFQYKNFSLNVLFETYQGADIYAGTKSVMYDLGTWGDSDAEVTTNQNLLDFNGNLIPIGTTFRGAIKDFGAGPVALTETWYNADGGFFGSGNDELYIEDGSWTRLRELSLSYRYASPWLKQSTGLSSVEVSATGRNLLLWTKFEGNDPDTNLTGVSTARGLDYFNNPGTKSYIFTLTLNL